MPRTLSSNEYEHQLLANIAEYGWQCTSVAQGKENPGFSYTIGLFHSFGHPELIVFGLSSETAHDVLSIAAEAAAAGNPLNLQQPSDALLEDYAVVFVEAAASECENYVRSACWYYEGKPFPLYQVVWPSLDGHFPWHPSATDEFKSAQPLLGAYAEGA